MPSAATLPTTPNQSENEIADNELDFGKDLPFEHEYYRTSTEHDEFIRPNPTDEITNIEGIDDGIDLNDETFRSLVPLCNYQITLADVNGTVDNIQIDITGLVVKNGRKNNLSLNEFRKLARKQIFEKIRHASLAEDTQKTVNDVTNYLRQMFTKTYGYEDSCGISITLQPRTQSIGLPPSDENDIQETTSEQNEIIDQSTIGHGEITTVIIDKLASENPVLVDKISTLSKPPHVIDVTEIQPDTTTTIDDSVEFITEIQRIERIVPKSTINIKAIIDMYKALNNWKFAK